MTISSIGVAVDVPSSFSPGGMAKVRKLMLNDEFNQRASLSFYDGNCAHVDRLKEGMVCILLFTCSKIFRD